MESNLSTKTSTRRGQREDVSLGSNCKEALRFPSLQVPANDPKRKRKLTRSILQDEGRITILEDFDPILRSLQGGRSKAGPNGTSGTLEEGRPRALVEKKVEEEEEVEGVQRIEEMRDEVVGKSRKSDASCREGSPDGRKVVASEEEERRRVLAAGEEV